MIDTLQSAGIRTSLQAPQIESAGSATTNDFATLLSRFASQTIDTIHQGEAAAIDGLSGRAPVQDVVDKVMAAEQALQTGIALRDKIVSAYLEISRMTI